MIMSLLFSFSPFVFSISDWNVFFFKFTVRQLPFQLASNRRDLYRSAICQCSSVHIWFSQAAICGSNVSKQGNTYLQSEPDWISMKRNLNKILDSVSRSVWSLGSLFPSRWVFLLYTQCGVPSVPRGHWTQRHRHSICWKFKIPLQQVTALSLALLWMSLALPTVERRVWILERLQAICTLPRAFCMSASGKFLQIYTNIKSCMHDTRFWCKQFARHIIVIMGARYWGPGAENALKLQLKEFRNALGNKTYICSFKSFQTGFCFWGSMVQYPKWQQRTVGQLRPVEATAVASFAAKDSAWIEVDHCNEQIWECWSGFDQPSWLRRVDCSGLSPVIGFRPILGVFDRYWETVW